MYEVIIFAVKSKLTWFIIHRWPGLIVVGIWVLSAAAAYQGAHISQFDVQLSAPTPSEMERHLESQDRRLDNIEQPGGKIDRLDQTINERFKELADDRKEQSSHSDARYEELSSRVSAIWYGLAGVGALLGLGIIRLKPVTGLGAEDMKTLTWFANELRNPRGTK